ncbi:MAG: diacylglycerol kinase family lipid kinase [Planctomycetes bacterium]|nr:diacylglycerol kinase family lipid kinase [Planctomycetota bacterium]
MKRYRVIVNPVAGHGNGLRSITAIKRLLTSHNLSYDLIQTEYSGHAIELTQLAALDGVDVIVAAGGDGTVNEVINGLMLSRQSGNPVPVLGVLCVGRGNDFADAVRIPPDLEMGCQVLADDQRRVIDIGRVMGGIYPQGRYFGNVVGVGFDTIATIEVKKLPLWGGFVSFFVAVLRTVFLYNKASLADIEFNGQTITQRSLLISVMNGNRLGGGFYMAPNSKPDDGLFDLCIAEQMSSFQVLRMIPHFMKGTQYTQPTIKTGQTTHITITGLDGPLPAQMDGEIISTEGKYLVVEIMPHQLEIIYQPTQVKA